MILGCNDYQRKSHGGKVIGERDKEKGEEKEKEKEKEKEGEREERERRREGESCVPSHYLYLEKKSITEIYIMLKLLNFN